MKAPRLIIAIALLVATSSFHPHVAACDCVPRTPEAAFAESSAVFSGRVAAIVGGDLTHRVFVDLLEIWKGDIATGRLVRVDTSSSTASCGFPFVVGEEYVIFASAGNSSALGTHICTPTGQVSRAEARDLFGEPERVNPLSVEFRRGDVDGSGEIDISDPVNVLLHQFVGTFEPRCLEALDFENNGRLEVTDAVALLEFLFLAGGPPAAPFPACGKDADFEPLECERYPLCPLELDASEIVRIENVPDGQVEIEVSSTRPFHPRALFPILCLGTDGFWQSRAPEGGDFSSLIFTLTVKEFEAARVDASLLTVQHGDGCRLELDEMTLYWDLWVLESRPVEPPRGP